MGHAGVDGSCRGGAGHVGVGRLYRDGVGWVIRGGGSYRDGVGWELQGIESRNATGYEI